MAESLDSRHGTSNEYSDQLCNTCYDSKDLNVRVCEFCKDCGQFLCSGCYNGHGNLQGCRHHEVVQGEDMPKSQADKPPRFEYCDVHTKLLKDMFCCEHKNLLCSMCSSSVHEGCSIKTVEDASKSVDASEIDALYEKIKSLQENLQSALPSMNNEIRKQKDQEKTMLDDAQKIYDQSIAKTSKLFADIKAEIQTNCQLQISLISRHKQKVKDIVVKLDSPLSGLADMKSRPVDIKTFLLLQEVVGCVKKFTTELQESRKTFNFVSFSLIPNLVQEYLSSSRTFGIIQSSESKPEADIVVPEISFLLSIYRQTATTAKAGNISDAQNREGSANKSLSPRSPQPLSNINATKNGSYYVEIDEDKTRSWITGMAISKDGKILMVDNGNGKVKMFSHDMTYLASVSVPGSPWYIAVINDKTAAVTSSNRSLVILDVSGSQLNIKTTIQLSYGVHGISRYNDKLVVTCAFSKPPSVKLIDQTGRVYWSVMSGEQGQQLFRMPLFVCSPGNGSSSTVLVSDKGYKELTLLSGDTGKIITSLRLKMKGPRDVTTDSSGNVYVNYWRRSEVAVLSGDLSEEKILLSGHDGLTDGLQAIVYDDEARRLIISYGTYLEYDAVDFFQS